MIALELILVLPLSIKNAINSYVKAYSNDVMNCTKIVLRIQVIRIKLREAMQQYSKVHKRITYQDLSKKTGLSKATLEALGSRPSYNTTLATIDSLCLALECNLADLLTFERDNDR